MLINLAFFEVLPISTAIRTLVSAMKIRCFRLYVSFQLPLSCVTFYNSYICKSKKEGAPLHLSTHLFPMQHQQFNAYTSVVRLTVLILYFNFPKLLKLSTSTKMSFICRNICLCNRMVNKT